MRTLLALVSYKRRAIIKFGMEISCKLSEYPKHSDVLSLREGSGKLHTIRSFLTLYALPSPFSVPQHLASASTLYNEVFREAREGVRTVVGGCPSPRALPLPLSTSRTNMRRVIGEN